MLLELMRLVEALEKIFRIITQLGKETYSDELSELKEEALGRIEVIERYLKLRKED